MNSRTTHLLLPGTLLVLAILASSCTSPAVSQGPNESLDNVSACDVRFIASANTPRALREFNARCFDKVDAYAQAAGKLNTFPVPAPSRLLRLQTRRSEVQPQRITLSASVYFSFLEAYPPDIAFSKLDDLIRAMNQGYEIEIVTVLGSADPVEQDLRSFDLARRRSDFMRRYLLAAGVPGQSIHVDQRGPTQPDTVDGRARDRVAEVAVVLLRNGPAPPADAVSAPRLDDGSDSVCPAATARLRSLPMPAGAPRTLDTGIVVVDVSVAASGAVSDARVRSSTEAALDEAAVRAVSAMSCAPRAEAMRHSFAVDFRRSTFTAPADVCKNYAAVMGDVRYPPQAAAMGIDKGEAVVQFIMAPDGEVSGARVSSTHWTFDAAALQAVGRLQCTGIGRYTYVRVPFDFRLQ